MSRSRLASPPWMAAEEAARDRRASKETPGVRGPRVCRRESARRACIAHASLCFDENGGNGQCYTGPPGGVQLYRVTDWDHEEPS